MRNHKVKRPGSVWVVVLCCTLLQFLLLLWGTFRVLGWLMQPERISLHTVIVYLPLNITAFVLLLGVWRGKGWTRLYFPFALGTFTVASLIFTILIRVMHGDISFGSLSFLDSMGHGLSFIISIIGLRTRSAAKFFENTKRSD
jgi:uncharacterized protein involved in response to NO